MTPLRDSVELPGGARAAYEVVGAGEPLLYFQGGPGFSASLLRDEAALLAGRFAIYLIDPHGSGGSTPPADPSHYDHLGHARFYDSVRVALGIERATIMGLSFGAIVALTYAALYPEVATRCIAVAGRALGDDLAGDEEQAEMEQLLARHAQAPWFPQARKTWDEWTERALAATDPAEIAAMSADVFPLYAAHPERPEVKRMFDLWRREGHADLAAIKAWESGLFQTIDIRALLGRVRCPTLLLAGELDVVCGPAHARTIADALPAAQVVAVPDCGHFIAAEAPDAFRAAIVGFCAA